VASRPGGVAQHTLEIKNAIRTTPPQENANEILPTPRKIFLTTCIADKLKKRQRF
jgi:hypothetical protein